jgi:DNA processing protein
MKCYNDYEIGIVMENNTLYPSELFNIAGRPKLLYYKGDISIINASKNLAVIGSRKMSLPGKNLAYETGRMVASKGMNVVNGLAIGCDTEAINGALSINGKCIAIMPCGLEQVQPKSNYKLAEKILEKGGCLLSEYPTGVSAKKYQYVERDRIQSGISHGVIVIETAQSGGTMHTVNYAFHQFKRLACYANLLVEKSEGNRLLENNKKTFVLNEISDTGHFLDIVENEIQYQQINLFDNI